MNKTEPLDSKHLYTPCDPDQFPFETTAQLEDIEVALGQERAVDSIQLGMRIDGEGYNIFALGPSGMGKFTAIRQMVEREAAQQPAPSDWIYVHNFAQPHRPNAIRLPAGKGIQFRRDMERLIDDLGAAIPGRRAEKQLLEFAAIRRSFAAESRERAENVR